MIRTICGHKPTRAVEKLYLDAEGHDVALCGRKKCEDAYLGRDHAEEAEAEENTQD